MKEWGFPTVSSIYIITTKCLFKSSTLLLSHKCLSLLKTLLSFSELKAAAFRCLNTRLCLILYSADLPVAAFWAGHLQ